MSLVGMFLELTVRARLRLRQPDWERARRERWGMAEAERAVEAAEHRGQWSESVEDARRLRRYWADRDCVALALPFAYHVGRCDNCWCSRIGFLEGHFVGGELAAWLCAGECVAYSESEDP